MSHYSVSSSKGGEISKPMNLLALDGGGCKGISSLYLLKAVMDEVKKEEGGTGNERLPADYFDLAAGTSTGGLMALMLFRLKMSTSQVIALYEERGKDIFSPKVFGIPMDKIPGGHWLAQKLLPIKALFTGQQFANDGLISVIDDVVQKYGLDDDDKAQRGEAKLIHQNAKKMFMCATLRDKGESILMRSYETPEDVHYRSKVARQAIDQGFIQHIDIRTAALATSAAPMYLPAVHWQLSGKNKKGKVTQGGKGSNWFARQTDKDELVFWDGGLLNNNPIQQIWNARYDLVDEHDPPPRIHFILSLGCSFPNPKRASVIGIVRRLMGTLGIISSFLTNTEAKNRDFWRFADRIRDRNDMNHDLHYLRLNVPTEATTFNMADWQIMEPLKNLTLKEVERIKKTNPKTNDITNAAKLLAKALTMSDAKYRPPVQVKFITEFGVPSDVVDIRPKQQNIINS